MPPRPLSVCQLISLSARQISSALRNGRVVGSDIVEIRISTPFKRPLSPAALLGLARVSVFEPETKQIMQKGGRPHEAHLSL